MTIQNIHLRLKEGGVCRDRLIELVNRLYAGRFRIHFNLSHGTVNRLLSVGKDGDQRGDRKRNGEDGPPAL